MTKLKHPQKNWAVVPLCIMFFCSPLVLFHGLHKVGENIEKLKKWVGYLRNYRNLHQSTSSFRSDRRETDKIVKIKTYTLNFPSLLSNILRHRCTKLTKSSYLNQLLAIYLFMHPKNMFQMLHLKGNLSVKAK